MKCPNCDNDIRLFEQFFGKNSSDYCSKCGVKLKVKSSSFYSWGPLVLMWLYFVASDIFAPKFGLDCKSWWPTVNIIAGMLFGVVLYVIAWKKCIYLTAENAH
jgi:hypothetical protein